MERWILDRLDKLDTVHQHVLMRDQLIKQGIKTERAARSWAAQHRRDPGEVIYQLKAAKAHLGDKDPDQAYADGVVTIMAETTVLAYLIRCAIGEEEPPQSPRVAALVAIARQEFVEPLAAPSLAA